MACNVQGNEAFFVLFPTAIIRAGDDGSMKLSGDGMVDGNVESGT
jgi:hypothetical protein